MSAKEPPPTRISSTRSERQGIEEREEESTKDGTEEPSEGTKELIAVGLEGMKRELGGKVRGVMSSWKEPKEREDEPREEDCSKGN